MGGYKDGHREAIVHGKGGKKVGKGEEQESIGSSQAALHLSSKAWSGKRTSQVT